MAAAVPEWSDSETIMKFKDAANQADEDIMYEAVSCVKQFLASPFNYAVSIVKAIFLGAWLTDGGVLHCQVLVSFSS